MYARLIGFVLALVGATAWASTYRFAKLKPGLTHGEYVYRFVGRGRARHFILEATLKTSSAGPAARIVLGYQDERNFYYAQAADTGCTFVKVEDGIEKGIGTPSGGELGREVTSQLTLVRWRHTMRLWLDGRLVAEAYDGTFRSGRVGLGGRGESVAIDTVRFQVVGDVRLSDDFMRTAAEDSVWQTVAGAWELKSLPSASLSANAFMFAGKASEEGKAALALRGNWFWHDYVASAACRPMGKGAVGLVFYCRGPEQYHLLRWEPSGGSGRLQLLRVAGEEREALGEAPVGFTKGQWYELKVRVVGQRATAYVDGNPLVDVADPRLVSGRIGLYCEESDGALFDDVEVSAPRDLEEDFERQTVGKWLELGGEWQRHRGRLGWRAGEGHCLVGSARGEGRYISGEDGWADYTVAADVLPPVRGEVGLVAHYQDEGNYYLFSLSPRAATLVRVLEGERRELARQARHLPLAMVHRLELSLERGVLTGRLNGELLVRRCDSALRNGRAGPYVRGVSGAGFDNVGVTFPRRPRPLFTTHRLFAAEASMENWAVRQSDWESVDEQLGGAGCKVRWHRADFPGDVEIEAKIEKLPVGGRAWLALGGDARRVASGYLLGLERLKKGYRVALERRGKLVAQNRNIALRDPPERFSAERIGHAVLAQLDDKVVLTYDAPQPLPGRRIGWAASGARVAKDGVDIFSRCVTVYSFHKAPVDWRTVAGQWEVTNRWACDPRWSFFAGEQRGDPLVAMWNKRDFGSDVTLEFAAGIRHDPDRGGTGYHYASDINAVICGDGADLRNGYNFIFGGWNNRCTRILRNGQAVAETREFRFPRDRSIHRRWFYFKMQKQGRRLRLYVDNHLALEYNDPQPLTGRKVAIWSWQNDIMVARVRVSAKGSAPCELPIGPPPQRPRCCYR